MTKLTTVKCGRCSSAFQVQTKSFKYRKKLDPSSKFYCSKECRHFTHTVTLQCQTCNKQFTKKASRLEKNNFCSHKCSAAFSNANRKLNKNRTKTIQCNSCLHSWEIPANAKMRCRNAECNQYCPDWKIKRQFKLCTERNCKKCNQTFAGKTANYCSECIHSVRKQAAIKSIEKQNRRSKNEIYFGELCQQQFCDVKFNVAMFNGWDADIILDKFKIAALWNGNWHYQKIYKNISLAQIQARDKIKVKEIINCGYTPYVIEDRGRHKPKFVEQEFDKFLDYIKNNFDY
jgi:hypothetical protein